MLAAPTAGGRPAFEAVAAADVVSDVVSRLPPERRCRVRLDLAGEGMILGDEGLLGSLVSNAIENALKFSDGPVEVILEETRTTSRFGPGSDSDRGPRVTIDFCDRGVGIEPDLRARVFEPFYRARADATPGHGLGLSLVDHIARAHGGRAAFVETDAGTRLRVELPGWGSRFSLGSPVGGDPATPRDE